MIETALSTLIEEYVVIFGSIRAVNMIGVSKIHTQLFLIKIIFEDFLSLLIIN